MISGALPPFSFAAKLRWAAINSRLKMWEKLIGVIPYALICFDFSSIVDRLSKDLLPMP